MTNVVKKQNLILTILLFIFILGLTLSSVRFLVINNDNVSGINLFTWLLLMSFYKFLLQNVFPSYSKSITQVYFFCLFVYFTYTLNPFGIGRTLFGMTVAHCAFSFGGFSLWGKRDDARHTETAGALSIRPGSGDGMGVSVPGDRNTLVFPPQVIAPPQTYPTPDLGPGAISGLMLIVGGKLATTPGVPTSAKIFGIGASIFGATAITGGSSAMRGVENVLGHSSTLADHACNRGVATYEHLRHFDIKSGSPTAHSPWENNSLQETINTWLDKIKQIVLPTECINNPISDVVFYISIIVFLAILCILYVTLILVFRDPIVNKILEILPKYGKLGLLLSKLINFTTIYIRWICILFLIYSIFLLVIAFLFLSKLSFVAVPFFK